MLCGDRPTQAAGAEEGTVSRIVVGVDGSRGAVLALEWALAQARLTGAALDVVYVYSPPSYYSIAAIADGGAALTMNESAPLRRAADEALERILTKPAGEWSDVEVEATAIEALAPAPALVECSKGADLLVVGSRGLGGFGGLLLGSVSQQCVQHAACPVVVVPPPDHRR